MLLDAIEILEGQVGKTADSCFDAFSDEMRPMGFYYVPSSANFIAFHDREKIICFLAYVEGADQFLHHRGGWTHPLYRGQGLYQKLCEEFRSRLRTRGWRYLHSGFHKDNRISGHIQQKQGRRIEPLDHDQFETWLEL